MAAVYEYRYTIPPKVRYLHRQVRGCMYVCVGLSPLSIHFENMALPIVGRKGTLTLLLFTPIWKNSCNPLSGYAYDLTNHS